MRDEISKLHLRPVERETNSDDERLWRCTLGQIGSVYYSVSHMMDGMFSLKLCEELANYSLCVKSASARENCHEGFKQTLLRKGKSTQYFG